MHGVTGFAESAALLVCAAFVLVTICSRIGVPSIVGYILAGIVIGPAGLGLIAESAALSSIGEIGVVLLLFALGLEFSFEKLVTPQEACLRSWGCTGFSHDDNGFVGSEFGLRSRISFRNPHRRGRCDVIHSHVPQGACGGECAWVSGGSDGDLGRECPIFCVSVIWSMLPERSKDDDDFERTAGRTAEGLQAA
ncbi:cation:proton antiporter [Paracoccus sp. MKU1]|uniref:cation:proton antiporter domain-containing protein n=1 Tax=Paracoccus sp. MKU1 TaxID=1745182 RepID=UPI00193E92BD